MYILTTILFWPLLSVGSGPECSRTVLGLKGPERGVIGLTETGFHVKHQRETARTAKTHPGALPV